MRAVNQSSERSCRLWGQKLTWQALNRTSALPPEADLTRTSRHVRFVPCADMMPQVWPINSVVLHSRRSVGRPRLISAGSGARHTLQKLAQDGFEETSRATASPRARTSCRRYRPAARHGEAIETSDNHVGFRCV